MHRSLHLLPDLFDQLLGLFVTLGQHWVETGIGIFLFIAFVYIAKILIMMMRDN